MTVATWTERRQAQELVLLASLGKQVGDAVHPAVSAIASLMVVPDAAIRVGVYSDSAVPAIWTALDVREDGFAFELLEALRADALRAVSNDGWMFDAAAWVQAYDFADLVTGSIAGAGGADTVRGMVETGCRAASGVCTLSERLRGDYLSALLERDLPGMAGAVNYGRITPLTRWMLALDLDGRPERMQVVERRHEAGTSFASLFATLRAPGVTAAVDAGEPVVPALAAALGLAEEAVLATRGAVAPARMSGSGGAMEQILASLTAHEVAIAAWPGDGRPDQPDAWDASPWGGNGLRHGTTHLSLFRNDIVAEAPTAQACEAILTDLVRPLLLDRLRATGQGASSLRYLNLGCYGLDLRGVPGASQVRTTFLRALRVAVMGDRDKGAIDQAAIHWSRRAADASAVRHELQQRSPGWPALCPAWRSPEGDVEIVAVTTARQLVDVGGTLNQCLGSLYGDCRGGTGQVLLMHQHGTPVAVAEIRVGDEPHRPVLTVGRFDGLDGQAPTAAQYAALCTLLRDLGTGAHPNHLDRIAEHRRRMEWGIWPDTMAVTLDHARALFGMHRPFLPSDAAVDYGDWVLQSGLQQGIEALLAATAGHPDEIEF